MQADRKPSRSATETVVTAIVDNARESSSDVSSGKFASATTQSRSMYISHLSVFKSDVKLGLMISG